MSSLAFAEKRLLEKLFQMSSGYVLEFSDKTFGEFFMDNADINIHSERYRSGGTSKANKLREFWRIENDHLVGKVFLALIEYRELTTEDPVDMVLAAQCRRIADRLLAKGPQLAALRNVAESFNARHLAAQIQRIEQSIESDPALAIGTAKELIETCCKTILAERGKTIEGMPDIPVLTKAVFKELKLVPEDIPDEAKGSKTIKVLLSNLATISQGLAELRGLYGTGHGKHGKAKGLTTRHARLAVAAAAAVATFLFETHKEVL